MALPSRPARIATTLVALLVCVSVAHAEVTVAGFEMAERAYHAGRVDQGVQVRHVFVLRNVGTADLTVDAKPGCSCTIADFDAVVAPGHEGKITAVLDTSEYKGRITKIIAVTTNDPTNRSADSELSAEVIPALTVTPTDFPVLRGKADELKPVEIVLASTDEAPFDILRVAADPLLTVRVIPAVAAAASGPNEDHVLGGAEPVATGSNRYRVIIAAQSGIRVGSSGPLVTITTSHPWAHAVPIRVNLMVLADVAVVPAHLELNATPATPARHVNLRGLGGDALHIVGVESSDPDFTATMTTVTDGREYDLAVRYGGGPERHGARAQLTVRTDDPRQPTIVIPLTGGP